MSGLRPKRTSADHPPVALTVAVVTMSPRVASVGSVDGMWVAVGWTSPEGGLAGGIFCRRGRARRCGWGWRWGAGLADQAELSGPGCGLGAVGRAELVQDVADVLLDGVEGDHQLGGDPPVRPASGQQVQHLQFAGG